MNEFNECVHEVFSAAGDIYANELFLKRTPTSDRLLADSELRYPYEGSKTLMHVFDSFDDKSLILELLNGCMLNFRKRNPRKQNETENFSIIRMDGGTLSRKKYFIITFY